MGQNPYVHPHLELREKMRNLIGDYQIHMGLEKLRVINRGGLLYIEQKDPFLDCQTPLIPNDPMMGSLSFHTLTEGIRQPVEFVETNCGYDLFLERYRYHKKSL
jgi:hypothetical protein